VFGYLQTPLDWAFGLGAGTLGFANRHYLSSGYVTVDGYYLILLGEYGLLGLLLYVALVAAAVTRMIRVVLRRTLTLEKESVLIACVASSVFVLLAGFVGNANSTFPQAMYLWVFLGVGLALSSEIDPTMSPASMVSI
jgi:hypothetical protein